MPLPLAARLRALAALLLSAAHAAERLAEPAAVASLDAMVAQLDDDISRMVAAARGHEPGAPPARAAEERAAPCDELATVHGQLRALRALVDHLCMNPWDRERPLDAVLAAVTDPEDRERAAELADRVPAARRVPALSPDDARALAAQENPS